MTVVFSGCFLPFLIIFNLLFGKLFFKTSLWLAIEGVLLLLFLINSYLSLRRMHTSANHNRRRDVIDIEGRVEK
jgi:hypothetical protein